MAAGGETCASYNDKSLKGTGISTASQTAWALLGIMAVIDGTSFNGHTAVQRGIGYLLRTQQANGTWNEAQSTGTGFPCHFYLKYHLYQQYFPLQVLARYDKLVNSQNRSV